MSSLRPRSSCPRWQGEAARSTPALLQAFADGRWIACAYANSHGNKAGGTLVARDSEGTIRAFFGHICGRPGFARGETLEEIYVELTGALTEVSLGREEPTEARSQDAG